jgi:hypothetical protein
LALLVGGCGGEMCENRVVSIAASPDGARDAVLFERNCGATTDFSTQMSILSHGERPTQAGNLFVADGNHGEAAAAPWGGPWAELRWLGTHDLLVRYDRKARVFRQEKEWAGTRIRYAPVPGRGG